jgi:hypothetical protein
MASLQHQHATLAAGQDRPKTVNTDAKAHGDHLTRPHMPDLMTRM